MVRRPNWYEVIGSIGLGFSKISSTLITTTLRLLPLIFGNPLVKLRIHSLRLEIALFRDILKVGLPASLSPILNIFTILCITSLVSRFGPAALAGYGIGARLEFLLITLIFGIGAALTSMVGVNMGASKVIWPVVGAIVRVFIAVGGPAVAVVYLGYGITSLFFLVAAGMLVFGGFNASSLWMGAGGRFQNRESGLDFSE